MTVPRSVGSIQTLIAEELELGLPEHETGWRRLLAREVFG